MPDGSPGPHILPLLLKGPPVATVGTRAALYGSGDALDTSSVANAASRTGVVKGRGGRNKRADVVPEIYFYIVTSSTAWMTPSFSTRVLNAFTQAQPKCHQTESNIDAHAHIRSLPGCNMWHVRDICVAQSINEYGDEGSVLQDRQPNFNSWPPGSRAMQLARPPTSASMWSRRCRQHTRPAVCRQELSGAVCYARPAGSGAARRRGEAREES